MKKLTKANVEALKNEMPVLEKQELEAVKGGGTVYNIDAYGVLGWDRADNTNLYVMSAERYDEYWRCACGMYDPSYFFGALKMNNAPEHLQTMYVGQIVQQEFLSDGESFQFVYGDTTSGAINAYYNDQNRLVYTISYGADVMANKDQLLGALQSARNNAVQSNSGM